MRAHGSLLAVVLTVACGGDCPQRALRTPTAPPAETSVAAPTSSAPPIESGSTVAATAAAASAPVDSASTAPTPPSSTSAAPTPADAPPASTAVVVPPLTDDAGRPLPQTPERPTLDSALFKRRAELLFAAIVRDDPALALPFFFPVIAYEQVKDIPKPARDWKWRLVSAFERSVHRYHKRLGDAAAKAEFVALDVPEPRAQWMKPGSEGNKLGYWRVLRSRLRYMNAEGEARSFEVTSLISWRGEWYVVHLDGFK